MKKLQIPLEDEFMAALKIFALQNHTTLKEVVIAALTNHINKVSEESFVSSPVPKPKPKEVRQPEPVPAPYERPYVSPYPNPLDYEPTDEDLYYILRKTAKTKLINQYAQFQYGPIFWMVLDGCKAHYDKNGDPIPYRFTDQNGKVHEPDAEQLAELRDLLEKPVKIEE